MKTRNLLIAIVTGMAIGAQAAAGQMTVTGETEFVATGKPGAIKIHGEGAGLSGNMKIAGMAASGKFVFPLSALNTGVGLRDEHMKEKYLETPKFPEAQLVLTEINLSANPETDGYNQTGVPFKGDFTVHGVTRPVQGTIDLATAAGATKGDARFEVKMSDFNFPPAKWLGMSVNDEVQVKVHIQAKRASKG